MSADPRRADLHGVAPSRAMTPRVDGPRSRMRKPAGDRWSRRGKMTRVFLANTPRDLQGPACAGAVRAIDPPIGREVPYRDRS